MDCHEDILTVLEVRVFVFICVALASEVILIAFDHVRLLLVVEINNYLTNLVRSRYYLPNS